MRVVETVVIVLLSLAALFGLVFLLSYINHRLKLSKEDKLFVPIGRRVSVNGHMMNVFSEGSGAHTLVFLSGGGTCSPVLDFKSLYSLLSHKHRIVVVERIGYGFSDVADIDRSLASVLSYTRQALSLSGIEGPFILCPHSMSGIEALYWAQEYPEEVTAIVGLDMAVPETYENYKLNAHMVKFGQFAANIGLTRLFPQLSESVAIRYGTLTAKEKALYKIAFYRRTATKTMTNELQQIKTSAALVAGNGRVNAPILLFSSDGVGTGWSLEEWRRFQSDYLAGCVNGEMIGLSCPHYVHDFEYEKIANRVNNYIDTL